MNSKIISGIFIVALLVNGCISEYNATMSSNEKEVLFVDGNIIENTMATFYITKSFPLDSIPDEIFIKNADLYIIGSNGYKSPRAINSWYDGRYQIWVEELDDDVEYGIQIEYDGDTYQSSLSKPLHTPEIDSVSWEQPEKSDAIIFRVSTQDDRTGASFFMWSYTEDWEITADYRTTIFFNPMTGDFSIDNSAPQYYCWRKNESDRFIVGSTESLRENRVVNQQLYQYNTADNRFSTLYSVNVTQRAMSKGAYEYYQNIIKVNEEMGGLFTPQPSELIGNITCITNPSKKAMGYVEFTKNTTQKRIFVYPYQLTRSSIASGCYTIPHEDVLTILMENNISLAHFYNWGYRPAGAGMMYEPYTAPMEWAQTYCTDCTVRGGTKNKPDFWPNDHQ